MKDDLAINRNPYTQDPEAFAKALCRNVESSSAIEGINIKITTYKEDGKYKFKVSRE